jgi:hypothetical protein
MLGFGMKKCLNTGPRSWEKNPQIRNTAFLSIGLERISISHKSATKLNNYANVLHFSDLAKKV